MSDRSKTEFVRALSAGLRPVAAPACLWNRVEAALDPRPARPLLPIAAGLLIAFTLTAAWYVERPDPALAIHREFVRNPGQFGLVKCQPAQLHEWIARNTGLALTLAARPLPDPGRVELVGARRLDDGKAAVFYRIKGYPMTLLISRSSHRPAPSTALREALHDDVTLYAWEAHGRNYTLVSSLPAGSRKECGVCHAGGNTRG
jgi:hypothetical protein